MRLKDITTKIGSGATPSGGTNVYLNSRQQFSLIRSQNVFDRHFESEGLAFISDDAAEKLRHVVVQPKDILLNITGDGVTFGRACLAPEGVLPACVNQHVSIIRVDMSQAEPGYILSYLTHPTIKHYIESFNAGGSRRAITKGHIESFEIPLPPLPQQKEIARPLLLLDEKIESNRRMNETLEAISRAIFKSWFIDFDPVLAKAASRQPYGMNHDTLALFPNSFEASGIGKIPMGWSLKSLGEVTSYLNRGISPSYIEEGGILVFNQKCVRGGHVDASKARRHDVHKRSIEGKTLKVGDVLVNSTGVGTLGRVGRILALREAAIVDSHVTVVRANGKDVSANFLGIALSGREEEIEAFGEGTTGQTELSRARLASLPLVVPPPQVLAEFDKLSGPMLQQVRLNIDLTETLAATQDALLPKLISGEIRVGGIEKVAMTEM